MITIDSIIAARLKYARERKGMTQGALAKELKCNRSTISRYEKAETYNISDSVFNNICRILGTSWSYLMYGKEDDLNLNASGSLHEHLDMFKSGAPEYSSINTMIKQQDITSGFEKVKAVGTSFTLIVGNNDMAPRISRGDHLTITRSDTFENDRVNLIADETGAKLRRLRYENGIITLIANSPDVDPIAYSLDEFQRQFKILGYAVRLDARV